MDYLKQELSDYGCIGVGRDDGTNGPDTRPAGGPEPTTDAGVGADAGRAHNPTTDPGADGTSGHVASADAGTAHNPTTDPDTRPGADAPGPPRT